MAKRKYSFDEAKIARYIEEGRGTGSQGDYLPWLNTHDLPSLGRPTRIPGRKSGRLHQLLSDLETAAFAFLDWKDAVVQVREQFPLGRDETREIASLMGVRHPRDPFTQVEIVMTTDLVADVRVGEEVRLIAWAVKPASELEKPGVIDKLEIERRYWARRRVEWRLATEAELPRQRKNNLLWLYQMFSLAHMREDYPGYWNDRCRAFLDVAGSTAAKDIGSLREELERHHGFGSEDLMLVIRHLAATKRIGIDLDVAFDVKGPLAQITFEPAMRLQAAA